MDQHQNGQCQKGPQQNELRQSGRAKKTCFYKAISKLNGTLTRKTQM